MKRLKLNIVTALIKGVGLISCLLIALCGCSIQKEKAPYLDGEYESGVWITYSELYSMLKGDFSSNIREAARECKDMGISDAYVHIRPFCDSIFKSELFPMNERFISCEYDALEKIISAFHSEGIRVHAWINPYRVSTSFSDINKLPKNSPAYMWLYDDDKQNDQNVCTYSNGIYLNPARSEVRRLIIDGIREIIEKYRVDGIHLDDYFYPTNAKEFDEKSYREYCELTDEPLELDDWRRANVNALISGCFTAVKFMDKRIVFSVSPTASIDKNYNQLYADVTAWMYSGCVDYIMPQLYFGFEYPEEEYRFDRLLANWAALSKESGTRLVIGLAPYKIGSDTKADIEWSKRDDILKRQIELCKSEKCVLGYCFFSYSSLLSNKKIIL